MLSQISDPLTESFQMPNCLGWRASSFPIQLWHGSVEPLVVRGPTPETDAQHHGEATNPTDFSR